MHNCNKEIVKEILNKLPENKLESLRNACQRNAHLTSYYGLEHLHITIYIEGWYIKLDGTRSNWSVWATDNDGEPVIERKPNENRLNVIYTEWDHTDNVIDLYKLCNN